VGATVVSVVVFVVVVIVVGTVVVFGNGLRAVVASGLIMLLRVVRFEWSVAVNFYNTQNTSVSLLPTMDAMMKHGLHEKDNNTR
jgi:hypothetical protein